MPPEERRPPPDLRAAVIPGVVEAVVHGASTGATAALAIGTTPGVWPLPGGLSLELAPGELAAHGTVDAEGRCVLSAGFPAGAGAGATCLLQAVLLQPGRLPHEPGALAITPLRTVRAPDLDATQDLVVLFGQSNMEGQAPVADLEPALRGPLPAARIWNHAAGAWQALHAGVNNTTLHNTACAGPELAFAAAATAAGRLVWLVKCAVGQTSLGPTPGPWNEWGCRADELYPEMLRRIDAACAAVRALRLRPCVRAICMMQGESDAADPALASGYRARLQDLVQTLRTALVARGIAAGAAVPFVAGLVNKNLHLRGAVGTETVRAAQRAVAAALPECATVETSDLPLQPDGVHLATAGVCALGRAFAATLAHRGWLPVA